MDARAATIIADRYELSERVGQGGCGVVYRATDRHTGLPVAIKMLSHATRQDPSFVERLVREQQALQALAGTHAVGAIDLCRANTGELCLVMEWLAGTDLEQRLTELERVGTPLGSGELWRVMEPVLQTLEKAHELGIVHRDVKPANIFLLSENAGVRLLDFGFSRLKSSATLTAADMVMGSPSYIAPEAWQHGSKAIEKQADLYAAGVIVFRALAGRVPFEGASLVETMKLVTSAPRPSLCELRGDLPLSMDEWVRYALAIAPERRFQHASSFLDALEAALSGRELPPHTLPRTSKNPETAPPPKTTPGERQNALSLALGRAASLLKRVAHSFSRAPADTSDAGPGAPADPAPAPLVRKPPPLPNEPTLTKPSRPPEARAEPDELIAELLPTSLPPPPFPDAITPAVSSVVETDVAAHAVVEMYEPLTPSRTISIEASSTPAPAAPPLPPALSPASEPEALSKSAKRTSKPRPTAQRKGTQRETTQAKATQPKATQPKGTATQPKAPRRRASRPKAAKQRVAAERPESSPPPANTPTQRRSKKTTAAAPSPKPKAQPKQRKRATKQAAPAKRAPAKAPAKSARTNSGNPDTSQTSKRASK